MGLVSSAVFSKNTDCNGHASTETCVRPRSSLLSLWSACHLLTLRQRGKSANVTSSREQPFQFPNGGLPAIFCGDAMADYLGSLGHRTGRRLIDCSCQIFSL